MGCSSVSIASCYGMLQLELVMNTSIAAGYSGRHIQQQWIVLTLLRPRLVDGTFIFITHTTSRKARLSLLWYHQCLRLIYELVHSRNIVLLLILSSSSSSSSSSLLSFLLLVFTFLLHRFSYCWPLHNNALQTLVVETNLLTAMHGCLHENWSVKFKWKN